MVGDGEGGEEEEKTLEFVYRISTGEEWEELQKKGEIFGGDLDRTTGFIHLSKLNQVSFCIITSPPKSLNSVQTQLSFCQLITRVCIVNVKEAHVVVVV